MRAPFPGFIEPCHPTLHDALPSGSRWVHEIKLDGYRAQAHLLNGKTAIYTRRGYDWTVRFQLIADAISELPIKNAVIDGEIIVPGESGAPDFAAMQVELAAGRSERFFYYAFDLLYLDDFDLRSAPLIDRKRVLRELVPHVDRSVAYSEHFEAEAQVLLEQGCRLGLEGIVSKRRDSPYRSGRGETWHKVKCVNRETFPIVGFVPDPGAIAALYLGRHEDGHLLYAGKAGTGFTMQTARDLRRRLDPLVTRQSPLTERVRKPKAVWVEPALLADVEYRAMTSDGHLRHASFKGLRDDLVGAPARKARNKSRR
jgi:bifunctional non-homologous end joining protein LigD